MFVPPFPKDEQETYRTSCYPKGAVNFRAIMVMVNVVLTYRLCLCGYLHYHDNCVLNCQSLNVVALKNFEGLSQDGGTVGILMKPSPLSL